MGSHTHRKKLSTSTLLYIYMSYSYWINKYGIIWKTKASKNGIRWESVASTIVENCKFWFSACAPHGCSAPPGSAAGCMHRRPYYSPPFYRTPGKMKSNSGAVCASVWKISTVTPHYDGRPFGKHCLPRWILLFMKIGRILNTLLPYCFVWRIDYDRIRYAKKKEEKMGNLKENLKKSICKFEYVYIYFIRKIDFKFKFVREKKKLWKYCFEIVVW